MATLEPDAERAESYRERGLEVLRAIQACCRVDGGGYASLQHSRPGRPPEKQNLLESYFFAETLKYLYLLFSPPGTLNLTTHVLTTEGHVLPLPPLAAGHSAPISLNAAKELFDGRPVPRRLVTPWW